MATVKLSALSATKALRRLTVKNTRNLVFHLGVPLNDLDDIEAIYRDGEEQKVHFVQKWLDSDIGASWEKLVSGLKEIQMHTLAAEIECENVPEAETPVPSTPAPANVPASPLQPISSPVILEAAPATSEAGIASAEIEKLEDKFFQLQSGTRALFSSIEKQDKSFLETLCDFLLNLPVAKRVIHVKFFRESEDEILEAKNIRKLFAILGRYCNYSNYGIIVVIIKKFGDTDLKKRMLQYCGSIKHFEMTTTIAVYLSAIRACPEGEVSKGFTRMAMKINKPTTACTLYEIRQLKEVIAENASIHSYSVYIKSIEESSVKLVLRVHPACAELLCAALTPDFMYLYNLADVKIIEEGNDTLVL
jgi:hypothetical protein